MWQLKEARCQDVKMKAEHWSISTDTEQKQEDKHCKGEGRF